MTRIGDQTPDASRAPEDGAVAKETHALYERLHDLRWGDGFSGPYAEAFCAILSVLGRNRSVREVVEIMPHFGHGFHLIDLMNAMVNLGLDVARVKTRDQDKLEAPALVLSPRGVLKEPVPYVILDIDIQDGDRIARVFDSETRETRTVNLDDDKTLRGASIYAFSKSSSDKKEAAAVLRAGAGFGWFRALAIRFYGLLAQILCLSFLINILGLATPLFIMIVYNRVISARVSEAFPYLVAGVTIAIACDWFLRGLRSRRLAWIAARIDNIIGNLSFSKLMRLSSQTSDSVSVTAQLLRLRSFESLRDFFNSVAFLSVMELPFAAIYLVAIFLIGGVLVAVPLTCVGLYIAIFVLMRKRIGVDIRRTARTGAASQRFLLETFAKTQDIQASGLGGKWESKYASLSKKEYDAFARLTNAGNLAETLAHGVTLLGGLATLSFGAMLSFSGQIQAGAMIACLILTWRTLTPFHNFCAVIQRFEQIRNSVLQIDSMMDVVEEEEARAAGATLKSLRGGVTFEKAGLRFDTRTTPIFTDISFSAAPGEAIGFTGRSGAGKSLILKLVQGMYDPSYGAVRIDGFDIRQLDTTSLRCKISYIPQQPQLFQGTIEENLRLVRPDASHEEIWRALDMAGATDAVKALAGGLATPVVKNRSLSFDLLMQISMARAYLLDGGLFLIDELPSPLVMGECGLRLKIFIRENAGKRTILVASQNEELLSLCDRAYEVTPYGLRQAGAAPAGAKTETGNAMERVA
ncbi:peptidase domain-containing ABC transporter [Hyphococcus luteus]|uniref:Lantibiotic ABC transporter n=1 Tax=Hyphococcus luteus TaxID=2058213 RepID=A0A2S7KA56_9PROT|nr:ATP-binding cassette domain-containing protein [Marinicaulis flavus]PQA89385.1 hypothetical protein CW354_00465 [Marinicaulis flavus]